jgi:glycosyltransferase involved in cell wall biosynthesis
VGRFTRVSGTIHAPRLDVAGRSAGKGGSVITAAAYSGAPAAAPEATGASSTALAVSVVVCAYTEDRWADLRRALGSVAAQVPAPAEIVLVIDHAPTLLARARAELDGVRVVDSGGPQGLSGARNAGISAASGDIIAFLDDDAYAESGWLAELAAPYADPAVVGTGGHAEAEWDDARPSWFPPEFDWVVGCSYVGMPRSTAQVRNPLGCNMSFRRALFGEIGGFRADVGRVGQLPVGCEETELCIRAGRARPGSIVVLTPTARVRHRVPVRRGTIRYFLARCYHEGRSKAVVAILADAGAALSSERAYATRTLPRAVVRGLRDTATGDLAGVARSAMVVLGLAATTAGYLLGRAALAVAARPGTSSAAEPPWSPPTPLPARRLDPRASAEPGPGAPEPSSLIPPVRLVEIELSRALPGLEPASVSGARSTQVFVRLHGAPLGLLEVIDAESELTADEVARLIEYRLGATIDEHLRDDGLALHRRLEAGGIEGPAPCADDLDAFAATGPPLTVAIPTRDRPDLVVACIDSVLATRYPRLEVLVVDNAPSSGSTAEAISRAYGSLPQVRYAMTRRAGTAHARNVALHLATSEIVAFLDDDVVVDPSWAAAMARRFALDARVGCVTGMIIAAELETWPQLWIEEYGGFGKGFRPLLFDPAKPPADDGLFPFAAGRYGSGANMAFRREALAWHRGFDRALGGATPARGGEDLAAFVDVILDGWRIAYEPRAFVRHHHHREYDRLRRVMTGYGRGLGGYLGRLALEHPGELPRLVSHAARGTAYLLDPRSGKNARKRRGYPAALSRLELAGLMVGPFAFAVGRLRLRAVGRRRAGSAGADRRRRRARTRLAP